MSLRHILFSTIVVVIACASSSSSTRPASQHPLSETTDLDGGLTLAEQSSKPADVELRETIRNALLADPFLSTTAKSVNIVSSEKRVTLRGVVANETEKLRVANYAAQIAGGTDQVNNLLQVPDAQ